MKTDLISGKKYINAYLVCAFLFLLVGLFQSWNVAFSILNLCLISAIMSIGINIQWGNSGIVNFGVMGFAAIGGLCGVLISMPPTLEVWKEGTGWATRPGRDWQPIYGQQKFRWEVLK